MKNRIKEIREEREIKQKDLCKIFDVNHSTMSGWENNYDEIPLKQLVKYSEIFNTSIDYLLYLSDTNKTYSKIEVLNPTLIGNNLKVLRTNKGYTQTEFANKLSISRSTYQKYEYGESLIMVIHYMLYVKNINYHLMRCLEEKK